MLKLVISLLDFHYEPLYWSSQQTTQEVFQPTQQQALSSSCRFKERSPAPAHPELLTHDQLRCLGLINTYIKPGTSPVGPAPLHRHKHPPSEHCLSTDSCPQVYIPQTPPSPPGLPSNTDTLPCMELGLGPHLAVPPSPCVLGSISTVHTQ